MPRRREPAPTVAPQSPEPVAEAPSLRGGLDFDVPLREPAPAPQSEDRSGGWVSDLLRRASQDDEPAPKAKQCVSLSGLSQDIAQAIEHDTAVSIWDRYQRGDRNIFDRSIYTSKGQRTFDEISEKYGRDESFRASVDRYVDDFERLIADVARNDRDNIMTQTYLTSDTGKVYTMLAHAAGRFN